MKSGGGPPHSKTLARFSAILVCAERLGVRQSSGALRQRNPATKSKSALDGKKMAKYSRGRKTKIDS